MSDAPVQDPYRPVPRGTNPHAFRIFVHTLVTPTIAGSVDFLRRAFDMTVLEEGLVSSPEVDGTVLDGRRYVLLAPGDRIDPYRGYVRLLEAPRDAAENRPRPGASITHGGLAVMECVTRDRAESVARMRSVGARMITEPKHYWFENVQALEHVDPGVIPTSFDMHSYSVFGPAGEQYFITWSTTLFPGPWRYRTLHSPCYNSVLIGPTRRVIWDFYDRIMGVKPMTDVHVAQEPCNELIGAPPGTVFKYSVFGEEGRFETWEYVPSVEAIHPTSLGRTGFAMETLSVDDLDAVRRRIEAAGVPIVAESRLPLPTHPEARYRPGFIIRGPVGELMEIVGRE
jgi:hypothetical protein